jgi:ubiquinol-cytochrome c reductase iron-sulfur subunit
METKTETGSANVNPNREEANSKRRRFLLLATDVVGGIAVVGAATPFVGSMCPSERAKAAGAPVEADIQDLAPEAIQVVEWRGKPVWIMRRNDEMLAEIRAADSMVSDPHSDVPQQPKYAQNEYRSIKPDVGVLVGVCTHLGCSPKFVPASDKTGMGAAWTGGFYCPCHGSKFDLAGRVIQGSPAPKNLLVPPYKFATGDRIVIGSDETHG